MFIRVAVSFVVIYIIFFAILALYERYIKKLDITNTQRYAYTALASAIWPLTIVGATLFAFVQLINFLKKL